MGRGGLQGRLLAAFCLPRRTTIRRPSASRTLHGSRRGDEPELVEECGGAFTSGSKHPGDAWLIPDKTLNECLPDALPPVQFSYNDHGYESVGNSVGNLAREAVDFVVCHRNHHSLRSRYLSAEFLNGALAGRGSPGRGAGLDEHRTGVQSGVWALLRTASRGPGVE